MGFDNVFGETGILLLISILTLTSTCRLQAHGILIWRDCLAFPWYAILHIYINYINVCLRPSHLRLYPHGGLEQTAALDNFSSSPYLTEILVPLQFW